VSANSFLDEAVKQNHVIDVARFKDKECLGRGRALLLETLPPFGPAPDPKPDSGYAVMLDDCGDPKTTSVKAGDVIRFCNRPGDGLVISSAADLRGIKFEVSEMTPEEVEEAQIDALTRNAAAERQQNIDEAERRGFDFQAGVGWVNKNGHVLLDTNGQKV
jgi:hypothetical protein